MGETEFRSMCENIKTGITQLRAERSRAAAVIGFLEGDRPVTRVLRP